MKRITAIAGCILAILALFIACKNTTVTVHEKKTQYMVDFDLQEGTAPEGFKDSVLIDRGRKVSKPTQEITRNGYTFQYWSTEENGSEYDFEKPVTEGFTLYAVWVPAGKHYTVSFNPTGGKLDKPIPPAYPNANGKIKKPAETPKRTGYVFKHWSKKQNGAEYVFDVEKVETSFTLYAVWSEAYTIKFNLNGVSGSAPAEQIVAKSGTIQQPPAPVAEGFSFKHWAINTEPGTPAYDFTQPVTGACTLYAIWQQTAGSSIELQYTISFNLNGGTGDAADQTCKTGSKLTKPADPVKEGYTFKHWAINTEQGTPAYNFETETVSRSFTLFAIWQENTKNYTITFHLNGGNEPAPEPQSITQGGVLTQPAQPARDGYTFMHWAISTESGTPAYDFKEPVTESFDLYAIWDKVFTQGNGCTVTFYRNDGTNTVHATEMIEKGQPVSKPAIPTRDGYTFKHWAKTKNGAAYDFESAVTADQPLYAVWVQITDKMHDVTFNYWDKDTLTKSTKKKVKCQHGMTVQPENPPTVEGWKFRYWAAKEKNAYREYDFKSPVTKNFTLYAIWEEDTENANYTVTFDHNTDPAKKDTVTCRSGEPVKKPANPIYKGYVFKYWSIAEGDSYVEYNFDTPVTSDIELCAVWGELFTVTFDLNGESGTPPASQEVEENTYAKQPLSPSSTGATFKYWALDKAVPSAYIFTTAKVTADITLYAIWDYPAGTKKHTVTFDLNGGTGTTPQPQQVDHGQSASEPSEKPEKSGKEFGGWASEQNNSVPYNFSQNKVYTSFTLYAIWRSTGTTIMDIQGTQHTSPMKGQQVKEVTGIVTAITYKSKHPTGFYMQDPTGDGNEATSDGIYVELKGSSDGLEIGAEVKVNGTVVENGPEEETIQKGQNKGKAERLTVTQINDASFTVVGTGKKLPDPIKLSEQRLMLPVGTKTLGKIEPTEEAVDYWESLEGMRVLVTTPKVVAQNSANTYYVAPSDIDPKHWSYRNGIMYNDYIATPLVVLYPPACFESAKDSGITSHPDVGDTYTKDITGVVGYRSLGFGSCYQVYPTEKLPPYSKAATPLRPEEPNFEFNENNLNIVSYNLKNFSYAHSEDTQRAKQFAEHFINKLKAPDVIALIEVQDDDSAAKGSTLVSSEKTLKLLLDAIKAKSSIPYKDICIYPSNRADGGQGGSNIRCAYLYRTDRLELVPDKDGKPTLPTNSFTVEAELEKDGTRLVANPSRIGTGKNGKSIFNSVRKSLVAHFRFKSGSGSGGNAGKDFFMICNHFSSKLGDDMLWGKIQPARRRTEERREQQAGVVREFISNLLTQRPDAVVVSVGDYNDYWFSKTLSIMKGDDLKNAVEEMPLGERYTFTHDGKSQTLDHILVPKKVDIPVKNILNLNSEFADGISDHDPVYVQLHW